jgi:predicted GH43/DUF377 family glycosyl hydrolase
MSGFSRLPGWRPGAPAADRSADARRAVTGRLGAEVILGCLPALVSVIVFLSPASPSALGETRTIIPAKAAGRGVDEGTMQRVYEEAKTPFPYGVVLRGEAGRMIDCPSIFRREGKWFMLYICMNEAGYETHLARSEDLLRWETLGKVLSFGRDGAWDQWQAAGGIALVDPTWGGSCELQQFDGKYWLSYLGGARQGYETDPLAIGIAWTHTPVQPGEWTRLPENPVLSTEQPDVREFERKTLYRSTIIWDKAESLGFPYVMFYNGKLKNGYERIGMAVSKDMVHWSRYGTEPVVANGEEQRNGMSGDPQIVRMGDLWVMFYFGAGWKPGAFDTFACSHDLVHWTQWNGPHLAAPSEPYDKTYAHKPWLLKHQKIVYHFYCAVGAEGRVIALATSTDLKK